MIFYFISVTEVIIANHTFCSASPASQSVVVYNSDCKRELPRKEAEALFRSLRQRSNYIVLSQDVTTPTVTINRTDNGVSAAAMQSGDY
jgi:hypothetical protein